MGTTKVRGCASGWDFHECGTEHCLHGCMNSICVETTSVHYGEPYYAPHPYYEPHPYYGGETVGVGVHVGPRWLQTGSRNQDAQAKTEAAETPAAAPRQEATELSQGQVKAKVSVNSSDYCAGIHMEGFFCM